MNVYTELSWHTEHQSRMEAATPELQALVELERKTHSAQPQASPPQKDEDDRQVHELVAPPTGVELATLQERTTHGIVEFDQ